MQKLSLITDIIKTRYALRTCVCVASFLLFWKAKKAVIFLSKAAAVDRNRTAKNSFSIHNHMILFYFFIGFQRKYLQLKASRDEFQNKFYVWLSTRKQTRKCLRRVTEQRQVAGLVEDSDRTGEAAGEAIALTIDLDAFLDVNQGLSLLGDRVADFAVFCCDHIDFVLSSELVDSEFSFMLYVLRGTHSPGAAANTQVPLSKLLEEELNIIDTRVITLTQLLHSAANEEVSSIIQQILHELHEGPNDEEVPTMIMNFIEAEFAEALKS